MMLPPAAPFRGEQLKLMSQLIHQRLTSKKFASLLKTKQRLTPAQKAALREWKRDWKMATKLPTAFVKKCAALTSQSIFAWSNAKTFDDFAPFFEKQVAAARQRARYFGGGYEALLDEYEPGMDVQTAEKLLKELVKPIRKIMQKKELPPLPGPFPKEKQFELAHIVMKAIGYEGRLDLSSHPFSQAMHPSDARITGRVDENDPLNLIGVVLHEAGHAFYEMGLPAQHFGTPLCEPLSYAIHESQSRWWEVFIGQSKGFFTFLQPHIEKIFPSLKGIDLHARGLIARPSLIRVDSDPITYTLHILLRLEIERQLIEGTIEVADVPTLWNKLMQDFFGLTPPSDRQGCLQDIHWSMGAFGYFPTYALGNLYAAQFFAAFTKQHKDWEKRIAAGQFSFIRTWLTENIHRHGRHYTQEELVRRVTGKPLSAKPFIRWLSAT